MSHNYGTTASNVQRPLMAVQQNNPVRFNAKQGNQGKSTIHLDAETRETLFAGKIDPQDPRLHMRGAKSPKAKNRAIEKKRSEERAEHERTVTKILDFAEGGSEEERH